MQHFIIVNCRMLPVLLIIVSLHTAVAQTNSNGSSDYYQKDFLRHENHVYARNVKTVQLHRTGNELAQPFLKLGSDESLYCSFDELDAELKNYSYSFIHCNADWKPSGLSEPEFIDGFYENPVSNYRYSFNTNQSYVHYDFAFPNNNIRFTKSGNYILKVFEEGNNEKVIITWRFLIFDEKVTINAAIKRPTYIEDRNSKHEIDFSVIYSAYTIANPLSDIQVVVLQNFRWDNAITGLKPLFLRENELIYDYDKDNVFAAGNEYRHFDIKTLRFYSDRISKIERDSSETQVYLLPDERRNDLRYFSQPDINGKYVVRIQEGQDSEIDADYVKVRMTLTMPYPVTGGNLYVFGSLTDWNISQDYRMTYEHGLLAYTAVVYVKQGYYDYEYVMVRDGEKYADNTVIEGSFFETENDYTILAYYREIGKNYDQLIGVKNLNSVKTY